MGRGSVWVRVSRARSSWWKLSKCWDAILQTCPFGYGRHSRREGYSVKVGVPREVKNHEYRVAITPAGVYEFSRAGHEVYVEAGAGDGSSIPDADFVAAGAKTLPTADDVWGTGDLILKV